MLCIGSLASLRRAGSHTHPLPGRLGPARLLPDERGLARLQLLVKRSSAAGVGGDHVRLRPGRDHFFFYQVIFLSFVRDRGCIVGLSYHLVGTGPAQRGDALFAPGDPAPLDVLAERVLRPESAGTGRPSVKATE